MTTGRAPSERVDLAVIGAGPAGLAVGVEAEAVGIPRVVILEKAGHICDTIRRLYPEGKRVDRIYRKMAVESTGRVAFETELREELLARMEALRRRHRLDVRIGNEVQAIRDEGGGFAVLTVDGSRLDATVVAVAIGIFGRPVKPSYPLPPEVRGQVFFQLPETMPAGREVLVVGGGDSAVEAACLLSQANRVTISYRRARFFRVNEVNLCSVRECCLARELRLKTPSDITALAGEAGKVKVHFAAGDPEVYDTVFYFLGGRTPQDFLQAAGVALQGGRAVVDASGESTVPRLFLVGDLVAVKGSIMAAFNSAAKTVAAIRSRYGGLIG